MERQADELREWDAYEAAQACRMRELEAELERAAHQQYAEQQMEEGFKPTAGSWWEVLGLPRSASWNEVQRTYRARIQQYHPDRVHGMGPEIVRVAEHMTAALNRARAEAEAHHRSIAGLPMKKGQASHDASRAA